jgi:peptide/nickel transport system permease protein
MPKFVMLWTDVAVWLLVVGMVAYAWTVVRTPNLASNWVKVFRSAPALASSVVLALCLAVTLADSLHYRPVLASAPVSAGGSVAYDNRVWSVLDGALRGLIESRESTYSRPLDYVSFTKESIKLDGTVKRVPPRLLHGGAHLSEPETQWLSDVISRALTGAVVGALVALALSAALVAVLARRSGTSWPTMARSVMRGEGRTPWWVACATLLVLLVPGGATWALMGHYHVFGTDITGNDVLFQTIKSIRTAFVIGALSTIATLPLAVVLGIMAGYYKRWVDEVIQYLYTVLSSIPNILLIAACVLMVQVFLDKHPELFETGAERADLKLFLLCAVLGLTGWAGLCRLLRAETLKLRELDYVQAATAFGVSDTRIMIRHIFPNVAHLMLIVTVLEFSSLILYEAVLALVGVGVDSSMNSFGGMINLARNEMSRNPVVWWPFAAAFVFMVSLVLAANLFADGVRDAFDPRARTFRPRVISPKKKPA